MLDHKKEAIAQQLAMGLKPKEHIAKDFNIAKATLYKYMKDPNMMARVDELKREFEEFGAELGKQLIHAKLVDSVEGYWNLIKNANNEMVAAKGFEYMINRALGTPASKHELTTKIDAGKPNVSTDILEEEHAKWERDIIDVEAEEL